MGGDIVEKTEHLFAGEGVEKREPSYTVGGNVKCGSHYEKQYGVSSKKLKLELLYDPAISLLGIYLHKTIIQKDTCTSMFTAALFTIVKTWKQPKCHQQVNGLRCGTYMEHYSVIKKNEVMLLAATWMDLEIT